MPCTIAIIEDEINLTELVRYNLNREGFQTISANNGLKGLELVRRKLPDLVILDLILPELDGLSICKLIRADPLTSLIPIIILTVKSEEADRVLGLEMGADDYVTKPFSPRELVARVRAVLRRNGMVEPEEPEIIELRNIRMDLKQHLVFVWGKEVELAPKGGRHFTREFLQKYILGYECLGNTSHIDSLIRRLRQKIEQ